MWPHESRAEQSRAGTPGASEIAYPVHISHSAHFMLHTYSNVHRMCSACPHFPRTTCCWGAVQQELATVLIMVMARSPQMFTSNWRPIMYTCPVSRYACRADLCLPVTNSKCRYTDVRVWNPIHLSDCIQTYTQKKKNSTEECLRGKKIKGGVRLFPTSEFY